MPSEPICIKMKTKMQDDVIITRGCHFPTEFLPEIYCQNLLNRTSVKFCEACANDGCNKGLRLQFWKVLVSFSVFINLLFQSL